MQQYHKLTTIQTENFWLLEGERLSEKPKLFFNRDVQVEYGISRDKATRTNTLPKV